jgi:ribosomal protein L37AE/L43A
MVDKRKMKRFCPNCGSQNIDWVLPQTWSKWRCKDCGYIGALIIEDGSIADQIRKEYLERLKNKK